MDEGATAQRRPSRAQRHPLWLFPALAAYVCSAAFFIGADAWDPLAEWGFGILLANSVAIGLVGGRWWMLFTPLSLIALAPLTRATEPPIFFALAVPALLILSAALIALGVGVRKRRRRRGAEAERHAADVGLGLLVLALAATGWGIFLDHRVVDRVPSRPVLVDERTGAYRGIAPGAAAARVRRLFGEPVVDSGNYVPRPLAARPKEVSSPGSLPGWQPWRYKKLVVFISGGEVRGYLTTERSAQTQMGVGVGDSLTLAKRRHPGLECDGVTLGSDAVNPSTRRARV